MRLDERVEVAAGVRKRLGECTTDDLALAQEVIEERARLRQGVHALLVDAARRSVEVPEDLLERLAAWDEALPASRQLHDELVTLVQSQANALPVVGSREVA